MVRALTRWGMIDLGLTRVRCRGEQDDPASRRVAEAGYWMEGLLRQGIERDGRRHDCWTGSAVSEER